MKVWICFAKKRPGLFDKTNYHYLTKCQQGSNISRQSRDFYVNLSTRLLGSLGEKKEDWVRTMQCNIEDIQRILPLFKINVYMLFDMFLQKFV